MASKFARTAEGGCPHIIQLSHYLVIATACGGLIDAKKSVLREVDGRVRLRVGHFKHYPASLTRLGFKRVFFQ